MIMILPTRISSVRENHEENQRTSMRIDLEVLNSFDLIMTTRKLTRDSECVSVSVCKLN